MSFYKIYQNLISLRKLELLTFKDLNSSLIWLQNQHFLLIFFVLLEKISIRLIISMNSGEIVNEKRRFWIIEFILNKIAFYLRHLL